MNDRQKKIEEIRRRVKDLDEARIRMVEQREKPVVIYAVSIAYHRELEMLKAYEDCSTHSLRRKEEN